MLSADTSGMAGTNESMPDTVAVGAGDGAGVVSSCTTPAAAAVLVTVLRVSLMLIFAVVF